MSMRKLRLLHSTSFPIDRYRDALQRESIEVAPVSDLRTLPPADGRLNVLLLDPALAAQRSELPALNGQTTLLAVGLKDADYRDESIYLHLPEAPPEGMLLGSLRRAYDHLHQRSHTADLEDELHQRTLQLEEINKVGIALSTVRDHDDLLSMILTKARELSRSDAGSLYLLDEDEGGKFLRWKLAQNDSIAVDFVERELDITKKSLAGYVALTGETLVIDDAYKLPESAEYTINQSFDVENGYLTKSMLVFPMLNHTGDIIGVLQLINRRKPGYVAKLTAREVPDRVIGFDNDMIRLMQSLAGQAAVALENNILYDSIERLFEGFVTASVTAIEQRDPTTSGHSFRVADLTVELAKIVDGLDHGPFRDARFTPEQLREVRYASLLHDFGKVGVRENVLVKEKKLYPLQIDVIRSRFEVLMKSVERDFERRRFEYLRRHGSENFDVWNAQLEEECRAELDKIQKDLHFIVQSNEPTVLPEGDFAYLQQLGSRTWLDPQGTIRPLLSEEEVRVLSIRKGNLDSAERSEIESHVTHTFQFLSKIPWTRDLRSVPNIAYAHHEKLNGRGYPRGLASDSIPLQSRMMTISDIYDALTAKDRPYKKAVPTDRALDILKMEVREGLLDTQLVDLFIDTKVFERAGIVR
jgi:HD-GYP domain-containing protein (c-di-GMP phosphodiesterase class II)